MPLNLQKFRSHKVVQAVEITIIWKSDRRVAMVAFEDIEGKPQSVEVSGGRFDAANVGDYLVIYEDGYMSVSPAKAFLEGYSPIVLTEADAAADLAGEPRPDHPSA